MKKPTVIDLYQTTSMKALKAFISLILFTVILTIAVPRVNAAIYTFEPNPVDMGDLDHAYYYAWILNWSPLANEVIDEATLTFNNIWDWEYGEEDYLYSHLLDNVDTSGGDVIGSNVYSSSLRWSDGSGAFVDDWLGDGPIIGTWSDPMGGNGGQDSQILEYNFSEIGLINTLKDFAADGSFGFGFDPDCHYYNDGMTFTVETSVIPEPTSLLLLGFGVFGLGLFRSGVRSKLDTKRRR